ncbi:MAG: FKBP-type peptidyl-prolyl cis-trans isomerase, partial [Nocardioidaceae bacterium]
MRRALIALLTVPLLFLVAVGCGSDSPSTSVDKVTVKGQEGKQPKVSFDKPLKASKTRSKVLKPGSGDKVTKGEHVVVNYVGVNGRTAKPFDSSWKNGQPVPFQMDETKTLKGFVKALVGKKVGSRVLMTIPPKDGYGKQGQSQAKIKGTDTLVFVVDVKKAYKPLPHAEGKRVSPPKGLAQVDTNKKGEPTGVTVPKGAKPPEKLTTAPLIKGDGAKIGKD